MSFRRMSVWGTKGEDGTPLVQVDYAFPAIVTGPEYRRIVSMMHPLAPRKVYPRRASSP